MAENKATDEVTKGDMHLSSMRGLWTETLNSYLNPKSSNIINICQLLFLGLLNYTFLNCAMG